MTTSMSTMIARKEGIRFLTPHSFLTLSVLRRRKTISAAWSRDNNHGHARGSCCGVIEKIKATVWTKKRWFRHGDEWPWHWTIQVVFILFGLHLKHQASPCWDLHPYLSRCFWTLTPSRFAAGSQHVLARRHGSWQRTRIVAGTAQWGKVSDAGDGYNGCISCNVSEIHFMVCLNLSGIKPGQTDGKKCSDSKKNPLPFDTYVCIIYRVPV